MRNAFAHSCYMTLRHGRELWRQPWFVAITLVQPIIWLVLFGALFEGVVDIPGFASDSYIDYLTPGIVVMSALFAAGWSGMSVINDLDRGVMDRFLVSPVRRSSLIAGRLMQLAVVILIQSLIIIGLGALFGASYPGGLVGILVLLACTILLGSAIGALSLGLALVARKEETLIGAVQLIILPLTFLSSAFMQQDLAASWIDDVAGFNPVNWAVEAGREALGEHVDWALVGSRIGFLAALAAVCAWWATRAFRAYQRSV
jgi:ABC-2 type transport system permease protein